MGKIEKNVSLRGAKRRSNLLKDCFALRARNDTAQSTIEFTFAVIVIMFIVYGMVHVFRWAGFDLAQRRYTQDHLMTNLAVTTTTYNFFGDIYNTYSSDPASSLNQDVEEVQPIAAIYHGGVATGNVSE